jgi:hypothetical protein
MLNNKIISVVASKNNMLEYVHVIEGPYIVLRACITGPDYNCY